MTLVQVPQRYTSNMAAFTTVEIMTSGGAQDYVGLGVTYASPKLPKHYDYETLERLQLKLGWDERTLARWGANVKTRQL